MAPVDEIGPWSREKLKLLEEYLKAYTSIRNTQRRSSSNPKGWLKAIHYIDAFAGSVTPLDKETQEYIDGSPLVAIKTIPIFDKFIFIDKDPKRIAEHIAPLQRQHSDRSIETYLGDCNTVLRDEIIPQYDPYGTERAFVFLDPYGLELQWETVALLGKARVFDVFINFSVMGVYRQLGDLPPGEADRVRIDAMMGCTEWFQEVYQESSQLTLPGLGPRLERQGFKLAERLAELYRNRLKTCFEHVSRAVIMRNNKGGPLYALILASQKKLAVDKMHEVFDRRERRQRKPHQS